MRPRSLAVLTSLIHAHHDESCFLFQSTVVGSAVTSTLKEVKSVPVILSLTPNPAVDVTLTMDAELHLGVVHRMHSFISAPGGKGINVSHALHKAGIPTTSVVPLANHDPLSLMLDDIGLPYIPVEVEERSRVNTTITEPLGRTTKINTYGGRMSDRSVASMSQALLDATHPEDWVVMAGSLPPGVPMDFYSTMVKRLRQHGCSYIVVDTSDGPMEMLTRHLSEATPDLVKPNAVELGQMVGVKGSALERYASLGDPWPVVNAAHQILELGLPEILVTLGAAGAVLVNHSGAWMATPPPTNPVSTVGAGDSALAGFLIGRYTGGDAAECLQLAVAYGSAATSLTGSSIPHPGSVDLTRTTVKKI